MANHQSAKKAHIVSIANAKRNKSIMSRVKTFIKSLETLISQKKVVEAKDLFPSVESEIMKANSKGVIKLNAASRKVSRLSAKLKSVSTQA
jgi:small subunit ribosomal protein S20